MKIGQKAPAFELESDAGTKVSSKSLAGTSYVLFFYPRDNTPGCTREAQAFRDAKPEFDRRGVAVFGVSADSVKSHCGFRDKHGLNFPLLADPTRTTIEAFGAYGEKVLYGKRSMGIIRSTVVVDGKGKVRAHFPKVKVDGHVEQVLAALDAME